jgi:hypothetical protein
VFKVKQVVFKVKQVVFKVKQVVFKAVPLLIIALVTILSVCMTTWCPVHLGNTSAGPLALWPQVLLC